MGCNGFVNEGNKKRNGSLVPRCHLPFSLVSLFFQEMKMRGSETSDQPTTVLDNRRSQIPRVPLPYLHRSSVNREDHLLILYDRPPTSINSKAASRPPSFSPVNIQIYILPCEAPHSLSRLPSLPLSLPPLPHFLLSLCLFQSPSLSLSSSLVVKIHPTAEWLLCLWVCAHSGSLSIWMCLFFSFLLLFFNLLRQPFCCQHVCSQTMPQVTCLLQLHKRFIWCKTTVIPEVSTFGFFLTIINEM